MEDYAVVFDCDGTLLNSHFDILESVRIFMSEYHNRKVSSAEVFEKVDADMEKCARNFEVDLSSNDKVNQFKKRWYEISGANFGKFALFDEIEELLISLQKMGIDLYVWTARDRVSTLKALTNLKAMRFFQEISCYDDTTPKPHPAGLQALVGSYQKHNVIHVGDSYTDVTGAHQFGIKCIGAIWDPFCKKEMLLAHNVDFLAELPSDILGIIQKIFKGKA